MDVFITIVIGFICLFTVICIHELGHYIVVRAAGVKVLEVGFGIPPRLFAFKRGDTEYSINLIPIGAFVRPEGEQGAFDAGTSPTPGSLASKSPWVRMGVSAAGPVANLILAFVLFSISLMIPMQVIMGNGIMVNQVNAGSPAEEEGILPGDIIISVNGQEIHSSIDLRDVINSSEEGSEIELTLDRYGEKIITYLVPEYDPEEDRRMVGVWLYPYLGVMVNDVDEDSPAQQAGIERWDMILEFDGERIYDEEDLSGALNSSKEGEEVTLIVLGGDELTSVSSISLVPDIDAEGKPSIGVEGRWVETYKDSQRYSFFKAISTGGKYIIEFPGQVVDIIRTVGWEPVYESGGGPIAVFQLTSEVKKSGLAALISLAGAISLAIGLFNLFPIPPLDGGGILIAGIEGVRRGKRLSPRAMQIAYAIGAALLITLFIMLTYNDILRLIRGENILP
jgi:regulator of sigma E protease